MDKTNFDLPADAAAIIFHQDMGTELIIPKMDDEETVTLDDHQNIFVAMAVASLLDDEGFRKYVAGKLETMLETAGALREGEDEEAPCCPSTGCAGCGVVHDADQEGPADED